MTAEASIELVPIELDGLPHALLREWLATMCLIRDFETACDPLVLKGAIGSAIHSSAGQEAVAVGSIRALKPMDIVLGSHRSHHHALAKGMPARVLMAELFGRLDGCSNGRGGTMHLRDVDKGYLGGNGIVGSAVGLGLGLGLASKLRGLDQVAVAFIGDGAANTGRTWESINLAAVWKVPLIVICENNLYAVETATDRLTAGASIAARASAFGLPAVAVDGQDVASIFRTTYQARERAATGEGPTFIEARTYRYEGHQTGQKITYRTRDEVQWWRQTRDPIERLRVALDRAGLLDAGAYEAMRDRSRAEVADAIAFSEQSPLPPPECAMADVTGLDLHLRGNPWES